jgi:hypothetical protein
MAIREMLVCGRRELCTAVPPPPFYLLVWCYNPRRVKDGPLSLADVCNWPATQKIVTYFDPDSTYLKEEQQQNVFKTKWQKRRKSTFILKCYRVIQPLSLDEFVFKNVWERIWVFFFFFLKECLRGRVTKSNNPKRKGRYDERNLFFFFLFFSSLDLTFSWRPFFTLKKSKKICILFDIFFERKGRRCFGNRRRRENDWERGLAPFGPQVNAIAAAPPPSQVGGGLEGRKLSRADGTTAAPIEEGKSPLPSPSRLIRVVWLGQSCWLWSNKKYFVYYIGVF